MSRTFFWLIAIATYLVFFSWYTSFEGPLTDEEIETILHKLEADGSALKDLRTLEHFMRSDTGDEFIMVNLLDLNETPVTLPATGPGATAMELMDHYMEHMLSAQLIRASHPVFFGRAVADAMDLEGIDGAEHWEVAALFRYRSRRDLIAIIIDPVFFERHDYKMAALTKTIAVPVEPVLNPFSMRFIAAMLIFSVFALIDMLIFRRSRQQ
ncbi:MAG: hypothetical protein VB957_09700 [Pseudomonadales bacterium]|jgi:hypothetical protein